MRRRLRTMLLAAMLATGAAAGPAVPAYAARLIASLSNHRVLVTSDFTGEELASSRMRGRGRGAPATTSS